MKKTLQFFTLLLLAVVWLPNTANSQVLNENFDSGTFPPPLWTMEAGSGNWDNSSEIADHTTGAASYARLDCYNVPVGEGKLITPLLTVTSTDKSFSFWSIYYLWAGTYGNSAELYVDVTNDDGLTWTLGTTNLILNKQDSGWFQTSIDLGAYESQNYVGDNVNVRFRGVSDYGSYDIGIDDVVGPVVSATNNDIGVTEILGDFGGFNASTADSVRVLVRNNGVLAQSNIPMKYTLDGGIVVIDSMISLAALSVDTFTFATTIDVSSDGLHLLKVYSDLATDEDRTSDTMVKNIVTPINTPVPYATSFPNNYNTHLELVHYSGSITEVNAEADKDATGYGIFMTSNITSFYTFAQADIEDAFTNTDQITEANFKVDATTNTYLNMSLDLKTLTAYTNCTWVRVMLNDSIYAKTLEGDSVWKDNADWQSLTFNLSDFAGTIFDLSIQGALKYNEVKAAPGNKVYIDNISFFIPPIDDIQVTEILGYYGGIAGNPAKNIKVVVKNIGVADQTDVPMNYSIDNGTVVSETMPILAALSSDTFMFATPITASTVGTHSIFIYSTLLNDEDLSNDTVDQIIQVYGPNTFPLNEDFESGLTYFDNDYFNNTQFSINTTLYHSGSQSVQNHYSASSDDKLHEAGSLDLTSTTNPVLDFWHIAKLESPNYDYGFVEISTNNGQTWTVLPDSLYIGESVNYSHEYFDETSYSEWGGGDIVAENTWWKMERFNLAPYKTDSISVRFNLHSDSGTEYDGWYIDDVSIKEEPTPMANLGDDTTSCGSTTFVLETGSGAGYSYLWKHNNDTLAATTHSISVTAIGTYTVEVIGIGSTAYDTIVIDAWPVITFNPLTEICENASSITLSGALPANGYYSGAGVDSLTGIFNPMVAGAGSHIITYTFTDISGCTNNAQQAQLVNAIPNIDLGADQDVCINHTITLDAGTGFTSYLWSTGATTQTINLDSLIFSVGNNDYSVKVTNSDNCNNDDTVTLIVDLCTGILTPEIAGSNINVIPNPSNGQFQIDISGLENKSYDLSIYNTIGSKVYGKIIESTGQSTQTVNIDFSTYSKGIYFVKLQSEGKIKVKKIIVQ